MSVLAAQPTNERPPCRDQNGGYGRHQGTAEQLALQPRTALAVVGMCLFLLMTIVGGRVVYTLGRAGVGVTTDGAGAAVGSGPELQRGREIFMRSCASCHGTRGQGVPRQGTSLTDSAFVRRTSDDDLVRFLQVGRTPGNPESVMNLYMPPRGGNPGLGDTELALVAAYVRTLQPAERADSAQ